jgi:ankyrin repeat protein
MKANIRSLLLSTCLIALFGVMSCGGFRRGIASQDGDCIPPQDMANLKLIMAAIEGDTLKMSEMIKAGANVNTSDDTFGTPLVSTVYSGNVDALKLLLDKGANANATDVGGCSGLAALLNRQEVVRLLVSRGADVNASCYPLANGKRLGKLTVLRAAKDNEATVKFLTDAGAKE